MCGLLRPGIVIESVPIILTLPPSGHHPLPLTCCTWREEAPAGASRACGRSAQLRGAVLRNPERNPVRAFNCNARTGRKMLIFRAEPEAVCSETLHSAVRPVGRVVATVAHHAVGDRFEPLENADDRPGLRLHGASDGATRA